MMVGEGHQEIVDFETDIAAEFEAERSDQEEKRDAIIAKLREDLAAAQNKSQAPTKASQAPTKASQASTKASKKAKK
jgi:hypothetical protein